MYVFVYNPEADAKTVSLVIANGSDAGAEIARTPAPVSVPGGSNVRMALIPIRANPPAEVGKPPAPGQKLAFVTQDTKKYAKLELRMTVGNAEMKPVTAEVTVQAPKSLIGQPKVEFSAGQLRVTLTGTTATKYSQAPYKVKLDLRPDLNPELDVSAKTGLYEAELPVDGTVTLVAEGLKFKSRAAERTALFAVNIDGYDRAYLIRTNLSGDPTIYADDFRNVRLAPDKLVPGKPVRVTVELDGATDKTRSEFPMVELAIDRTNSGDALKYSAVGKPFTDYRKSEAYVKVSEDALTFSAVATDWSYDFATEGASGKIDFLARLVGPQKAVSPLGQVREYGKEQRTLIVDRTQPGKVELAVKGPTFYLGEVLAGVTATAEDDLSGVAKAYFFLGEPPVLDPATQQAKIVPGKVVEGTLAEGVWVPDAKDDVALRLPTTAGRLQVGVIFVNGVGLATEPKTKTILVTEKPGAEKPGEKPTTGKLKVRIVQGPRLQPNVPIELRDDAGKVVRSLKADKNLTGEYTFDKLPPGTYTATSSRVADRGVGQGTVEAGKTADLSVKLEREPVIRR